jgi:hypothetical protein
MSRLYVSTRLYRLGKQHPIIFPILTS